MITLFKIHDHLCLHYKIIHFDFVHANSSYISITSGLALQRYLSFSFLYFSFNLHAHIIVMLNLFKIHDR